jgi:hypothetical protein
VITQPWVIYEFEWTQLTVQWITGKAKREEKAAQETLSISLNLDKTIAAAL